MTLNEEREKMQKHFSDVMLLIKEIEKTCVEVHKMHEGHKCNLGTDCPFHAAFEVNTVFGCRLQGLKSIIEKRKRVRVDTE